MNKRIQKEEYYINIEKSVSQRSPCLKRHYGCIIVKNDEIIATGYNGNPRGMENCCDKGYCNRMNEPSNSGDYSNCFSVHAEQNAMLSAARKDMLGSTMYLYGEEYKYNVFDDFLSWNEIIYPEPCPICQRMIINSGIEKVVTRKWYDKEYKVWKK